MELLSAGEKKLFVFACHKFHNFMVKNFVFIGHLPLKSIFKRSILKAPPHKKVSTSIAKLWSSNSICPRNITIAGTLSRASLNDITPEIDDTEIKCYVYAIESNYLINDYRLQQIQHEIKTNESLQALSAFIQNGWPKNQDQIPEKVRPYYTHRQELTYSNRIIFKGTRMLAPKTLRNQMKRLLHTGHLWIVKTINRAKEIIYWSGINNDITNIVHACEICLEHRNKNKNSLFHTT